MNRGLVDIVSNVLSCIRSKDDRNIKDKNRYDVVRYTSANEYIEPKHIDRCDIYSKPVKHQSPPPRYYRRDVYNDNSTHIEIYGDVNTTITITGGITCGSLSDIRGFARNVSTSRSYSDKVSDRNDRRDEQYRESLQRFYRRNMFNM